MSVDVGNLSYEVTEDDFKSVFALIGLHQTSSHSE